MGKIYEAKKQKMREEVEYKRRVAEDEQRGGVS
jgi:hypothetical protein